jgi:hypothetical protein
VFPASETHNESHDGATNGRAYSSSAIPLERSVTNKGHRARR